MPARLESRAPGPGGGVRWSATGLAIPVGIPLSDGRGGFDVIESRAAFIASEGRPVGVYDTHDRERLLGWATLVWHGDGWHARGSVAAPPSPAAWSPMFRSLQSRDADGVRYHQQAELIELSLAEPRNAIWGERTRASIGLEVRDRWGHRTHSDR